MYVLITRGTNGSGKVQVRAYGPYETRYEAMKEAPKAEAVARRKRRLVVTHVCEVTDNGGEWV